MVSFPALWSALILSITSNILSFRVVIVYPLSSFVAIFSDLFNGALAHVPGLESRTRLLGQVPTAASLKIQATFRLGFAGFPLAIVGFVSSREGLAGLSPGHPLWHPTPRSCSGLSVPFVLGFLFSPCAVPFALSMNITIA